MVTTVKAALFGREARARRIPLGLFRGLEMQLDLTCQMQLFLGLAERETYNWIRQKSRGAATAIDIGAGDGELTVYFLKRTAARKVFAFEPSRERLGSITANLTLNGLSHDERLRVCGKLVGSRDDHEFCTLDSLGDDLAPTFIKIDVDGAEMDVLKGAAKLLQAPGSSWLVETHSVALEESCLKTFREAGYKTRIVPHGWYRSVVPETRPSVHNRWLFAER